MSEYASTTVCRMEFLPRQPDDEGAKPCGRCDNCAGARFTTDISVTAMDAVGIDLDRAGVEGGTAPHGADRPSGDRR